jgi:hypothetical protein
VTRIILESKNDKDVLLIKELADRLKIDYKIINATEAKRKDVDLKDKYNIIDKGADVSNYGDPSQWQKKVRKDRNINLS